MDDRRSIYVLLVAALICAISVLLVLQQINDTRIRLQKSGPGPFNYIWQVDRNIDTLTSTIDKYLKSMDVAERQSLWKESRLRFDLVWSTFGVFDIRAPGASDQLATAITLKTGGQQFLTRFDQYYSENSPPSDEILESILAELREMQSKIHAVGLELFHSSTGLQDEISQELDDLYRYLWISGLLLLLTGTVLIIQLFRSIQRSTLLFEEARTSQAQLERVVGELRSGRLEQKAKDSFLAAASHDLRQPLHALGLFVNALENKVLMPDGPIILDKIKQSTEALGSLFNSLLDISRLDAGVVDVAAKHFDIGELFDSFREEFEEIANARNLALSISHQNEVAHTDPVLLSRILRNLIDNAIVHTRAGYVELACEQKNKTLQITVTDTGPGIPQEEQASIFSEYYQLDNPERDRSKGLGLGLSIVKRLSELLKLELSLDSVSGRGTTFQLAVPIGVSDKIYVPVSATESSSENTDFNGALVIFIDDEQDVREGMELILGQVNCSVLTTESGEAARDTIVACNVVPQVLIADYRLREGKTGIQAVEMVREELNDDVPALIVTGDTSPERVREVAGSGMKLLHKPVKPNELIAVIKSMLDQELAHLDQVS